jgi:hypothetical protein
MNGNRGTGERRIWTHALGTALLAALVTLALPAAAKDFEGALRARGTGELWAFGRGEAAFQLSGEGELDVRHILDNSITIRGSGQRRIENDTVTYKDFTGSVTIKGQRIAAHFSGGAVELRTSGQGSVVFAGDGTYWRDGRGPYDWGDFGSTVAVGQALDEDEWEDLDDFVDAVYEARSLRAVTIIRTFPHYVRWSAVYPDAALVLLRTRRYHDWAVRFPVAVSALYNCRGWTLWLNTRPFLGGFVRRHRTYVTWSRTYPTYGVHFRHPHHYYYWRRRHPRAHASISVRLSFGSWSVRHPRASRRLIRRHTIRKRPVPVSVRNHVGRPRARRAYTVRRPDRGGQRPRRTPDRPKRPDRPPRPRRQAARAVERVETWFNRKETKKQQKLDKLDARVERLREKKEGDPKALAKLDDRYEKQHARKTYRLEKLDAKRDRKVAEARAGLDALDARPAVRRVETWFDKKQAKKEYKLDKLEARYERLQVKKQDNPKALRKLDTWYDKQKAKKSRRLENLQSKYQKKLRKVRRR